MASVICITNTKGGVGKTTTAVNLSTALALAEKRTLLVDMDPQGHAGGGFTSARAGTQGSLRDAVTGRTPIAELIEITEVPFLEVLPASRSLLGLEAELGAKPSKEYILRRLLEEERERRDFIILDTPPWFGLLTINAMVAADFLLIPLPCDHYALEDMPYFLDLIGLVKTHVRHDLRIGGILLTMFDPKSETARSAKNEIRGRFHGLFLRTRIPRDERIRETAFGGRPHLLQDLVSPGAKGYLALAGEIIDKAATGT